MMWLFLIVYLLNNINNKIRNDFITSFIIIIINFTIFIISKYISNDILNNINKYWSIMSSFLVYLFCMIIPLFKMVFNNNIKENNENDIYLNDVFVTKKDDKIVNVISNYQNLLKNNHEDINVTYVKFYNDYILDYKKRGQYVEIIQKIEYKINNNNITKNIFHEFITKITNDTYIKLYENNFIK